MDKSLIINNITKVYTNSDKSILKDFSLEVTNKEFLCILGPSGCGKTTLLRCVAGFEEFEGEIFIDGKASKEPNTERILVFQDFEQLFPWKTVLGNISYALKLKGEKNRADRNKKAEEILKKVGLYESRNYYPYQLSGGMKQRGAIARALVLKPKLILMDEPFASLDAMTRRKLQTELLSKFEDEDITIVFVTHNIQEALILGTRVIVLSEGGNIVIDKNDIPNSITPESPEYGELWSELLYALENGKIKEME